MSADIESQRLKQFRQARRSIQQNGQSLEFQKKQTLEELVFLKEKLARTAQNRDEEGAKKIFERLVHLRARLAVCDLIELEEQQVVLDQNDAQQIMEDYRKECLTLAFATDSLLGIDHSYGN